MPYKNSNVNTNILVDKTNFAKFYGTSQTKCKGLSLSETKDFWKDNLKRVVPVLQSSRELSIVLKNKWENNRVFLDAGPVTLQSYHITFSLKVSWL